MIEFYEAIIELLQPHIPWRLYIVKKIYTNEIDIHICLRETLYYLRMSRKGMILVHHSTPYCRYMLFDPGDPHLDWVKLGRLMTDILMIPSAHETIDHDL
jgi:hypothetical protein